jgi:isopentenyl diphosphate isomerase/L-lactate dehydrogenase-like FMN-dependent dehydrogenase
MIGAALRVCSPHVVNIEDLRRLAKQYLPRVVFDYLDGGAETELTLRENCCAFDTVTFRPRHAVAVGHCDLRTKVLGSDVSFPAMLAPIGYTRLIHASGELAVARAAGAAGIGYTVATFAGHKLEDVKAAAPGPLWYQLYLVGGRQATESAIERAHNAGYSALVITVDTPVAGLRERDLRNGMTELLSGNISSKLPFLPQFLARPKWLSSFLLDGGLPRLENVIVPGQGPMPLVDVSSGLASAVVTWSDLRWIREIWSGPIVVKGILTGDDARRAVDEGAAGIVVSNHGGRQLDGVPATLKALPEVVSAVNGRSEVLMDGGVRRGSDIVKAVCLGARAVLIGRAYAYGLGAAGEAGVARALEILRADVERTMRLLGCGAVAELGSSLVSCSSEHPR